MIAKDSWMCMEEGIELNFKGAAQSSRESRVFFTFLSMLKESEFIVKNVSSWCDSVLSLSRVKWITILFCIQGNSITLLLQLEKL